ALPSDWAFTTTLEPATLAFVTVARVVPAVVLLPRITPTVPAKMLSDTPTATEFAETVGVSVAATVTAPFPLTVAPRTWGGVLPEAAWVALDPAPARATPAPVSGLGVAAEAATSTAVAVIVAALLAVTAIESPAMVAPTWARTVSLIVFLAIPALM